MTLNIKEPIRIAVDANFLIKLLDKRCEITELHRIEHLLYLIKKKSGSCLIIPMPSLAEYLVHANEVAQPLLEKLESSQYVKVAAFDRMAAVECSAIEADGVNKNDKRHGIDRSISYQKIKVDRQIVAIAKACGATYMLSDDSDIPKICRLAEIIHVSISDIPYPDHKRQRELLPK